jgi:hypothetical protein
MSQLDSFADYVVKSDVAMVKKNMVTGQRLIAEDVLRRRRR